MSATIVLGVDGGGTKTRIVALDPASRDVLASTTGESTNPNSVGDETAQSTLTSLISAVVEEAKSSLELVTSISLCMAGVDRPEDREKLEKWIRQHLKHDVRIQIENDSIAALLSGTNGELEGVVVISGTGTITAAVHKGKRHRVQGWGCLLGDEGGGDSIGLACLRAVTHAQDGGPATKLTALLLKHLNLESPWNLIQWCYNDKFSFAKFAALSRIVFDAAKDGDEVAKQILAKKAEAIVDSIKTALPLVGLTESNNFPLVLAGGNLTHDDGQGVYMTTLRPLLETAFPKVSILLPSIDPAHAAALLAVGK